VLIVCHIIDVRKEAALMEIVEIVMMAKNTMSSSVGNAIQRLASVANYRTLLRILGLGLSVAALVLWM